jgi:hypothetical protein
MVSGISKMDLTMKKKSRKSSKKKLTKSIQKSEPELAITDSLKEQVLRFIEYHPARRVSRNLVAWLLESLQDEAAGEPLYFHDLMYDLEGLLDLLDTIEEDYPRFAYRRDDE